MKIGMVYKHFRGPLKYKNIEFVHGPRDITIYRDRAVSIASKHKGKRVAWLVEPPCIMAQSWKYVRDNGKMFYLVVSHHKQYLRDNFPFKGLYAPFGGRWVEPQTCEKTKAVSIIASGKRKTEGHKLRHEVIKRIPGVDVFGRGYKPIKDKSEALAPYRATIVIENCRMDGYFSEKLIDALTCECIAIYWGDPGIKNVFDSCGIRVVNDITDIKKAVEFFSDRLNYWAYYTNGVENNKDIAKSYSDIYENLARAISARVNLT